MEAGASAARATSGRRAALAAAAVPRNSRLVVLGMSGSSLERASAEISIGGLESVAA